MKILNKVVSVLTVVFSVAALVLFFIDFGKVILDNGTEVVRSGAEFAFGSKYAGNDIGRSSDILFCILLSAFTILFAALSFKFKKTKWATIGFSIVGAVYMLVVACSSPHKFIDTQGFEKISAIADVKYVGIAALLVAIALFLAFFCAVADLLIADKIACAASRDKLTIPQRIAKFFRDYKGEINKIVWPGPRYVVKNTLIVLFICLLLGLFIWLLDWGLGELLDLILKNRS